MAEINFFWDPLSDNILQERDETGAVTAEYTCQPGLHGNVISQNRGGVESQFHFDAEGSVVAVSNDDQDVTDTLAYTAFGEVTDRAGTTELPFEYIGQKGYYRDSLTGDYVPRMRPYSPTRGRWLAVDPVRTRWDANFYEYARNNPLRYIDPSGAICVFSASGASTWVLRSFAALATEGHSAFTNTPTSVTYEKVTKLKCMYDSTYTTVYRCPPKSFNPPCPYPFNICQLSCKQWGTSEPGAQGRDIFVTGQSLSWGPTFWPQGAPGGIEFFAVKDFSSDVDRRNAEAACEYEMTANQGASIKTIPGQPGFVATLEKRGDVPAGCKSDCPLA